METSGTRAGATLLRMDSTRLAIPNACYDLVLLFFLLHEQPKADRFKTMAEAMRVTKPGGKIVVVDYARPRWWNPLGYLLALMLALFEPFAFDLWRGEGWVPKDGATQNTRYFGGMFQKTVITRAPA